MGWGQIPIFWQRMGLGLLGLREEGVGPRLLKEWVGEKRAGDLNSWDMGETIRCLGL